MRQPPVNRRLAIDVDGNLFIADGLQGKISGVSARSDATSISQPLIHNVLQRFALLKPAILP